jgi:predicted nucleic acid-binding protein
VSTPLAGSSASRHLRGLLDTSVVIALERFGLDVLPDELAVSALTVAELAAGPHATTDVVERAARQDRLQRVEATFDPLPFDLAAARAYGRVLAAVVAQGRSVRGRRAVDLMVAATALATGLPLYTADAEDVRGLEGLIEVVVLAA